MQEKARLGIGKSMIPVPAALVKYQVRKQAKKSVDTLGRLTEDHHRVRDFVVRELHRRSEPFSPTFISQSLNLSLEQTKAILDDLEEGKIFLFRAGGEDVVWAYPITRAETPHKIAYVGTDEQGYAACGIDVIAAPFVLGQLRQEDLTILVSTECAHSRRAIHIEIDSDLAFRVQEEGADPWLYLSLIDFDKLTDPSITDAF